MHARLGDPVRRQTCTANKIERSHVPHCTSASQLTAWLCKEGPKTKQPYFMHLVGRRVMHMAGLFDCWHNGEAEPLYTYTILTTDSCPRLGW